MKNGLGYSFREGSKTQFIDIEAAVTSEPARDLTPVIPHDQMMAQPWSPWGKNNLLPLEMLADIKTCGPLQGMIEGITRHAACQGILPANIVIENGQRYIEYIDDDEIFEFLETNNDYRQVFGWIKDYVGFSRGVSRIVLNRKQNKIATFSRDDVTRTRFSKMDDRGRINHVWYSAEWNKVRGETDKQVFKKPHLNPNNPYRDLRNRIEGGDRNVEFALSFSHPGWDELYYPVPLWMSVLKWIKIAQAVPEMKAAMYENSMRLKYIVIIQDTYWPRAFEGWKKLTHDEKEKIRNKVYDEIDEHLVGSENAGKAIFTNGYRDRDGKIWADIEIKPVEDSTRSGDYLPDSASANTEIAIALLWNLAMQGGNQKDGPYQGDKGGSTVREAGLSQTILREVERQAVCSVMNVVKYYNGWNKKYPKLKWVIPATVLTTLDTGHGSKDIVTGGANPKKKEDTND
jgi:hypothetical protein